MTDHDKVLFLEGVLRIIALSYRDWIDMDDTPPYVFAGMVLQYLGEDISRISVEHDRMYELILMFREWRKNQAGA